MPTLQGVSRALRLLELVAQHPMNASDAAEAMGLSWATFHRTLSQLEQDQFIERDSAGILRIGRRSWLLGSTYLVGHRLLELAIPHLRAAAEQAPFAVFQLVERSEGNAVVLYSHEAMSGEIITRTTYGYHFPLHCGSKGFVLLAYSPEAFVDEYLQQPLLSLTPTTVTDPEEIRQILTEVRAKGYSRTVGDVQPFTGSVAAPVFDSRGDVIAAACAIVSRSHLDGGEKEDRMVQAVTSLAQSLSLGMGWQLMRAPNARRP